MNKIFKYLMGVFIIGIGIINTTNATNVSDNIHYILSGQTTLATTNGYKTIFDLGEYYTGGVSESTYCIRFTTEPEGVYGKAYNFGFHTSQSGTPNTIYKIYGNQFGQRICPIADKRYFLTNATGFVVNYQVFDLNELLEKTITTPNCPTCEEQYTSLQCQTEYNLIPIEDVTANYCKLNFDLIEPTECPNIGEGTGEINRTARYINNVQYPGTASLKIDIADFLEYNTTYNSGETIVDIIGVDADEEYIEDIITKTQITPTAEDFGNLINGLQAFIPYVMIGLLLSFAILLIKKVFK